MSGICHEIRDEKVHDTDLCLWVEHAHLQLVVLATAVGLAEAYQAGPDAEDQVVEGLWAGNQVEGGRQGAALVKVGEPQLGSGKLPLHISILLQRHTDRDRGCIWNKQRWWRVKSVKILRTQRCLRKNGYTLTFSRGRKIISAIPCLTFGKSKQ